MPIDENLSNEQKQLLAHCLINKLNDEMFNKEFDEMRDKIVRLAINLNIPEELDKELDKFIATKNQRFYN